MTKQKGVKMFKLDPNSETPLYMQIVEQTKVAIAAGYLQNGDKFPSVRDLSKELLINQTTVSKAFKELSNQGIIKTQPGIGTNFWKSVKKTYPKPFSLRFQNKKLSNCMRK